MRRNYSATEVLEGRLLLSVVFEPGPLIAPNTLGADTATGLVNGTTETALAINPTDPAQIALSNQAALIVSNDAGASFSNSLGYGTLLAGTQLPGLGTPPPGISYTPLSSGGDPDVVFDDSGRLFWTNLAPIPAPPAMSTAPQTRGIAIAEIDPNFDAMTGALLPAAGTSTQFVPLDPATAPAGTNYDKQLMATDLDPLGDSPYAGNLYIAFAELNPRRIYFSRSTDNGATWSVPIPISDFNDPIDANGAWNAVPFVLTDGTVGVSYRTDLGFNNSGDTGTTGVTRMRLSTDGGMSFGPTIEPFPAGESDVHSNVQTWNQATLPGGGTIFVPPQNVSPTNRTWFFGTNAPLTRGDYFDSDTIYVVQADDPDGYGTGDFSDIVFARSTDGGTSWTRSTITSGVDNSMEIFPMFDVDPVSGTLVVAWYSDQRGIQDPNSNDLLLDVFASYSTDDGLTWAPEFMVNNPLNPFTSVTAGSSVRLGGQDLNGDGSTNDIDGDETYRMGEYQDLVVYGNTVHIAWNGNTFDAMGNPTGTQAYYKSFALGGTVEVNGLQGVTDDIVLRNLPGNSDFMEVVVNNQREYVGLWEGITSIEINGGGDVFGVVGADTITIEDLPAGILVTVNGGPGPNTITIGDGDLDNIQGTVSVNGDASHDTLVIDDSSNATSETYTINSGAVTRSGLPLFAFTYSNIESLEVDGGTSANTFEVNGTAGGVNVTVTGGPSSDIFQVGNGDIDSNLGDGLLHIVGGSNGDAGDHLILEDTFDDGNDNYFFNGDEFNKFNYVGTLTYAAVERITLDANNDSNSVHVLRTPTGTGLTINVGGGEANNVFAGNGDFDSNIRGHLTVNGAFGFDRFVILDDLDNVGNDTYIFDGPAGSSPATFDKTSYNWTTSYSSFVNSIELEASDFDNTVLLNGAGVGAAVILDMNFGDDDVYVGSGMLDDFEEMITVDGGAGIDDITLRDETDTGDDTYWVGNNFALKSTGFSLSYENAETLTLNANPDQNTINVESVLATTPMWINAGDSSDTIHLAPTAQQLSFIQSPISVTGGGGVDNIFLHDELSDPDDPIPFSVTHNAIRRPLPPFVSTFALSYEQSERLLLQLGAADDLVDIESTAPGTHVVVEAGAGSDTVLANVPTPAQLTLDGGTGIDTVELLGTAAAEEVSISAGSGADAGLISFENASIDLAGGTDVLVLKGVPGVDEDVEVQASTNPHEGTLSVLGSLDLLFMDAEIIDLLGNPGDMDTAAFVGTDQADEFEINLGADGTNNDPVLQVFDSDADLPLLTLRDYTGFNALEIRGGDGADTFTVYALPAGPGNGRNLSIDGGSPSGPGNPKDVLTVYRQFQPPPPPPDPNPGGPGDFGSFEIEYEFFQFLIDYSDIEQAQVLSVNAAN